MQKLELALLLLSSSLLIDPFLPVSHWFYHLKHSASLCLEKITISMSDVEENAISKR